MAFESLRIPGSPLAASCHCSCRRSLRRRSPAVTLITPTLSLCCPPALVMPSRPASALLQFWWQSQARWVPPPPTHQMQTWARSAPGWQICWALTPALSPALWRPSQSPPAWASATGEAAATNGGATYSRSRALSAPLLICGRHSQLGCKLMHPSSIPLVWHAERVVARWLPHTAGCMQATGRAAEPRPCCQGAGADTPGSFRAPSCDLTLANYQAGFAARSVGRPLYPMNPAVQQLSGQMQPSAGWPTTARCQRRATSCLSCASA